MPDVTAWAKLAAYIISIGLMLEYAHRLYWYINKRVMHMESAIALRSLLSALAAAIPLLSVLLLTWFFCAFVDKKPMVSLGLMTGVSSPLLFLTGVIVAFTCVAMLFAAGYAVGWFKILRSAMSKSRVPAFCGGASDFLLAAVFEEIIMRGYIFALLEATWGGLAAIVGSALIFSAFHLIKHPRMPLIFALNAIFFGLITGYARFLTGTLWVPIGLHFGWNLAMGPIFGLPCSGRTYDGGIVCCAVDGPEWVTGGLYSPDAGLLGTAALIIATATLITLVPIC
jgi:uncharacterized protein